ncbi:MAG: RodZ domain-containing protein [Pseudomonadota bacterium]
MTDEAPEPAAPPPDPLQTLRKMREAAGREIDGLARELHIDASLLEALEAGDYERLGAPVYVKGHLKRYALAVGADVDALLADYDALHADDEPPPVVPAIASGKARPMVPLWLWIASAVGLLLIVVLLAFFFSGSEPPPRAAASPAAPLDATVSLPAPVETAPSAEASDDSTSLSVAGDDNAPPTAGPARSSSPVDSPPVAQTIERSAVEPRAVAGNVSLQLDFNAECWTEVRDANRRVLYSGTAAAGDSRQLSGASPLAVVVGNRAAVTVRVDGQPFAIPASAVRGRTARFSVPGR